MSNVTEVEHDRLSSDLFWSAYHHDGDHFEKLSWTGYNDGFWWSNVANTDQFLVRKCKCGKKFRLNLDEHTVTEEFETCPNGHQGVERPTGGMPQPCSKPNCEYYRRVVSVGV